MRSWMKITGLSLLILVPACTGDAEIDDDGQDSVTTSSLGTSSPTPDDGVPTAAGDDDVTVSDGGSTPGQDTPSPTGSSETATPPPTAPPVEDSSGPDTTPVPAESPTPVPAESPTPAPAESPTPFPAETSATAPTATPAPTPEPLGEPDEVTGVLIVGAGPSGMAAAVEAQSAGVPYIVVDMDTEIGGSCRYAGGSILFAGTSEQAAAGVQDSPEQLLAEWHEMTGGDPDNPWVQAWAYNAVTDVHDWLKDFGAVFQLATWSVDAGTTLRIHQPEGRGGTLTNLMAEQLQDADAIHLQRQITSLVTMDGRVIGAKYTDLVTGATGWIQASSVVMATGGFLRDLNRVYAARPELEGVELWYSTAPLSQGLGLQLLEDLDALEVNVDAVGFYAHGTQDYRRLDTHEELAVNQLEMTMFVNADGERFMSEADYHSFLGGELVVNQPDGIAWAVLDFEDLFNIGLSDPMIEPSDPAPESNQPMTVEAGLDAAPEFFKEAESLEELADQMGIDADAFLDTVSVYNAGNNGSDAFGKSSNYVHPLDVAPYYAIRIVPVVAKGFGGISVNLQGQVADQVGVPIDGLYAAGELTGMAGGTLVDDFYFTGSLSAVIYSGRIAGRYAAQAALQ